MEDINRVVLDKLYRSLLEEDYIEVIYGPRQSGKTTLLNLLKDKLKSSVLMLNGDNAIAQRTLSSRDPVAIRNYLGENKYVFIDEAQRVEDIGINLKIIKDQMPDLKIVTTGSSSFELAEKINEPLTGRKRVFMLYPLWVSEIVAWQDNAFLEDNLENLLRFGSYPKVVNLKSENEKVRYLQEVVEASLYKDILELADVKNPRILKEVLALLAFQIGNEVSYNELANALGVSIEMVKRYLDLLEKAFIIVRIGGFSRNLRKEITANSRYYFVDLGVRNTLIRNYNGLSLRNDVEMLWENFLVMERLKKQLYTDIYANNYFWRTHDKKEVDWVEEREGKLFGFEFKWSVGKAKKAKAPKEFVETYKGVSFEGISQHNYLGFVI
ncbi:MAG: ATP-binding protein [Patescibacteria group bacterium]